MGSREALVRSRRDVLDPALDDPPPFTPATAPHGYAPRRTRAAHLRHLVDTLAAELHGERRNPYWSSAAFDDNREPLAERLVGHIEFRGASATAGYSAIPRKLRVSRTTACSTAESSETHPRFAKGANVGDGAPRASSRVDPLTWVNRARLSPDSLKMVIAW